MILQQASSVTGVATSNSRRWRALLTGTALGCSLLTAPALAQVIDQTSADDIEIVTGDAETVRGYSTGGTVTISAAAVANAATSGSAVYGAADAATGNVAIDVDSVMTGGNGIEARTPGGGDITIDVGTVDAGIRGIYTRTLFLNSQDGFTSGDTIIRAQSVIGRAGNAVVAQGYSVLVDADRLEGFASPDYTAATLYVSAGQGGANVDVIDTVSHGYGQWGIQVYSAGETEVVSSSVTTDGIFGRGISANFNGNGRITSVTIATAGQEAHGIFVDGYTAEPASVVIDSGKIATAGDYSTAIYATGVGSGPISISSDEITATGVQSHGIVVAGNPNPAYEYRPVSEAAGTGALSIVSGTIDAAGPGGRGIIVDHQGPISVSSDAITADGSGIYMWAKDTVDIVSGSVTTAAGPGIVVYGAEGDVTLNSGTVSIGELGDAGIYVETSSGNIDIVAESTTTTSVPILYGFTADGVVGRSQTGNVSIDAGSVSVAGEYAWGIGAVTNGTTTVHSDDVETSGIGGTAIYARGSSGVTVDSVNARTAGDSAHGIQTRSATGATVINSTGTIETQGQDAHGIYAVGIAEASGAMDITSAAISVSGDNASAIRAENGSGDIVIRSGTTVASGNGAPTILATATTGNVLIESVDASATGTAYAGGDWTNDAIVGLSAEGSVTINSGTARSDALYGSAVAGVGASVSITSDHAITTGNQGAAVIARTQSGSTGDAAIVSNLVEVSGNGSAIEAFSAGGRAIVQSGSITSGGSGIRAEGLLGADVTAGSISSASTAITLLSAQGDVALKTTGAIASDRYGVYVGVAGEAKINVEAESSITGGAIGIFAEGATLDLTNAGVIRGNGTYDGFDEAPHAGITLAQGDARIVNTGTISGAGFGITTAYYWNPATQGLEPRATGTLIDNSGTIRGDNNDAIRLIGGGTIDNKGMIEGVAGELTDGISMFELSGQETTGIAVLGSVTNHLGATISGSRMGIILSGGGDIDNAGTISGGVSGVLIQTQTDTQAGKSAILDNSGAISGASGVRILGSIDTTEIRNSGEITGSVDQGVYMSRGGTLENSGTITGAQNDAVLIHGFGSVVNSGTIKGVAGASTDGVQLQYYPGVDSGVAEIGSVVNEANGTITGARYGIILAGGGTIENAGTITGGTTGVVLVNQNFAGKTGSLSNSGTINGGVLINLESANALNSGTINDGFVSEGAIELVNKGAINGGILLSGFDDLLVLGTGSAISGAVDGGEGDDALILDGTSNALTNLQTMTAVQNFETLSVAAGYWVANSQGAASVFDSVSIAQGATLDVREVSIGGGPASTILTEAVENNGLLILNFNSDELADIEVLDITGTGDVRLDGEANFVLDQAIMAFTGKAIVANGSLTLAGTGGLSGDVETSGDGTFVLGDGGTTGSFAGNLVNNGRFVFNRTDDYSFLGDFSGTGSFTKMGAGVLTFAGDYSYTGTTVIEGGRVKFLGDIDPETEIELEEGTFDISDKPQTVAQLSGTQDSAINVNNSQLTVNQTSNTSYAGAITGDGAIVKSGTGTLNLTGNSTYTGPTTVNGGALAVNGSIVSTVTVNDGGTLKGNGTVGGATVTSNGTVAPGNSIGTLRVAGDVNFAIGSTYEVEVNADGRSDQILATGRAIIQGGTVAVVAEAGTYRPFTEYLIIGADGGVTGTFNNVTSNFAYLTPTLTYGTNAVRLQLLRNDIDFAAVTVTDNQASTANAVESLGVQNDLYGDIAVLTEAGARTAFDALSGEAYASIGSGILANGRLVADALLGAADTGGTGVWAQALGDWGSFDAAPGVAGLASDHQGVIGGVNYGMNGFSIGAAFGASKSDYDVRGRASQAEVDTKVAGVHAGYGAGPVTARIGGSYAWHDIDASRSIVFPSFSEDADAAYDATTMQLFGEVGYKVPVDAAVIEPFARIEHLRLKTDGFAEDGDTAALTIDEDTRKLQFLSLGVRATGSAPVSSTLTLEPQLSAAWRRGWGDLEGRSSAAFDGGDAFDIVGARLPKNALDLDVGVGLRSGNVRVGVSYRGILSNQWNSDGGQVSIGFTF